jgi:hypothetical protein
MTVGASIASATRPGSPRRRPYRRRDLKWHSVYRRAIRGLLNEGDYQEAALVQRWYDEFRDARIDTLELRKRLDRLDELADREVSP